MAKKTKKIVTERDSTYLLKLFLYLLLGAGWLHVQSGASQVGIPLPLGFAIGVLFARHEHFQIDRKIEYAFLLLAVVLSFFLPIGFVVQL